MNKSRILVVEDEAVVSLHIEECLKDSGYEVVDVVDTGELACEVAAKKKPDLVLMDVILRGEMTGIEAAAHILDELAIPVVYLTAHADEATLQRARVTTPYGFLLKPFEIAELRPTIEIALARFEEERASLKNSRKDGSEAPPRTAPSFDWSKSSAPLSAPFDDQINLTKFFELVAPFADLPEEQRKKLELSSQLKICEADEYLFYEGDDNTNTFLVLSGRVIMVKSSLSGKELIVDIVPPGDVLPLSLAMENKPYPFTAKTQGNSRIVILPTKALRQSMDDYPEMCREISQQISARLRESFDMSRRLAHDRVEVRVAAALMRLRRRLGISDEPEEPFVLELTRKELADLTGMTPETASRVAKSMESEGLIDLNQAGLVTVNNPAGLEDLIAA